MEIMPPKRNDSPAGSSNKVKDLNYIRTIYEKIEDFPNFRLGITAGYR